MRILLALLGVFLLAVLVVSPAKAVNPVEGVCQEAAGSPVCEAGEGGTTAILGSNGLMNKVVQMFVYLAGAISVIGLTVAGIQYVTSNGDPGSIQTAKNAALYSVIGLIVAIFAQAIIIFVLDRLK